MPGESSLSFFVRTRCEITAFDSDIVYFTKFISEYTKFNDEETPKNPVPVTKRAMEKMGVKYERLTLNTLKSKGKYRLVMSKADDIISKPDEDPWTPRWWFYDIWVVVSHIILICILLTPITCFIV